MLIGLGLTVAGIYAAVSSGLESPFWLAAGALIIAVLAAWIAASAHFRLSRIKSDYFQLAGQFERAVYRLEKRNDMAQSRLTQVAGKLEQQNSPRKKTSPQSTFVPDATQPAATIIAHPRLAKSGIRMKPMMIEGGIAAAERMSRERKAIERSFKKAVETGNFPLSLQPVLEMPDGQPVAYLAFGRLADHDLSADAGLPESIDSADFCERLVLQAARVSGQLLNTGNTKTPIVCGLSEEFVGDSERVQRLARMLQSQPALPGALIFAIGAEMARSDFFARSGIDQLAATGADFAISGPLDQIADRPARSSLPVALILLNADEIGEDANKNTVQSLALATVPSKAKLVAAKAEGEQLQIALQDRGIRFLTSDRAAPARLVKPVAAANPAIMAG